jgi:hypothetical protein
VRRKAIRRRWAGGWKPGFGGIEAGDAARSGSCGAVVRVVGGPPWVSRRKASFKATVGNWNSVARQIPIIPSTDRLLRKGRVEAAKTSVGIAGAGRATDKAMQLGRNGPNESRAGTPESASWKAKAGWRWRESHRMERSRIPWVSSCCRTATNGCGTQLLGDAPGWRRRTSPAERTMAKRAQEKKYKTLTV